MPDDGPSVGDRPSEGKRPSEDGTPEEDTSPDSDVAPGDEASLGMPVAVRWAMSDRRHSFGRRHPGDPWTVDACLGSGDSEVFAIDDGDSHCMVGRIVGTSDDGCTYCLVGRIDVFDFIDLRDATVGIDQAFATAGDLALCGVFESDVHSPMAAPNVFVVQRYRSVGHVPEDYLPPSPRISFTAS
jgi:hypothetical protein